MKIILTVFIIFGMLLSFVPLTFAHITLDPQEAEIGRQIYSIRVPNERDIATTKVEVVIPDGVDITGVLPIYGWQHTEEKQQDKITKITWSEGKINAGEYMVFNIASNYTGSPAILHWEAYQTYADGEVVMWDDRSQEHPAPKVRIMERVSTPEESNYEASQKLVPKPQSSVTTSLNMWISGVALIISLIALVISLKGKKLIL